MAIISFRLKGVKELFQNLDIIEQKIEATIKKRMKTKIAPFMEKEVKRSAGGERAEPRSVDTGNFRNRITGRAVGKKAIIKSAVDYAVALEFGTSKRPARRHFRNSLSRNKSKIINSFKNII